MFRVWRHRHKCEDWMNGNDVSQRSNDNIYLEGAVLRTQADPVGIKFEEVKY